MKPRSVAKMNARIRVWQEALGLGGWQIAYSPVEPDPDARASSQVSVTTRMACVQVQPDAPESQLDREIVHELSHVLLAELAALFEKGIESRGSEARDILEGQWSTGCEQVIERLVDVVTAIPRGEWVHEDGHNHGIWATAFPV